MMSTTTEYFLNFSQPLQHKFVVKIKFTPFLEFRRCVFFISKIGHSLPLYSLLSYLSSNFYTIFFAFHWDSNWDRRKCGPYDDHKTGPTTAQNSSQSDTIERRLCSIFSFPFSTLQHLAVP